MGKFKLGDRVVYIGYMGAGFYKGTVIDEGVIGCGVRWDGFDSDKWHHHDYVIREDVTIFMVWKGKIHNGRYIP